MTGRISVPGISHGDRVLLTGSDWRRLELRNEDAYEVDDVTFHRPVVYLDDGLSAKSAWFIFEPSLDMDWSVTKVEP